MNTTPTLDYLLREIRSELYRQGREREWNQKLGPAIPFVTISRQAGAGGRSLGIALVAALNQRAPEGQSWTVWDRELVEKVAAEHRIDQPLVESLDGPGRPWFEQFFSELDDMQVYRRVVATIRSLARAGRAVIIGRGGVFATGDITAGVHVRLVAPLEFRIENMAKQLNLPPYKAEEEIRRIEHDRALFYERHWPTKSLIPEAFTLTINTAAVDERTQVRCVIQPVDAVADRARQMTAASAL